MNKPRGGSYHNRSFDGDLHSSFMSQAPQHSSSDEKPSFSSLFTSNLNNKSQFQPSATVESFSNDSPLDTDGVYLQISNLDQVS